MNAKKKVALVYNLNSGKEDFEAEFDVPITIESLLKSLSKKYEVKGIEATLDFPNWISELINYRPDIIFNVAEGYAGAAREAFYPALFEQLGFKYTGPDSTNLLICLNKYLTNKILNDGKIMTPKSILLSKPEDLDIFKNNISFPLIVKLNSEGSSLGLSADSIVNNYNDLNKQIVTMWNIFHKNILVEEYISGFDVSMIYVEGIGPLGPAEVSYGDKSIIYDSKLKTVDDSIVNIEVTNKLKDEQIQKLKYITSQVAKILDIKGYCKLDFRIDNKGCIYLIEVNGQVSFHPNGEFIVCAKAGGHEFENIVLQITDLALKSQIYKNSRGVNFS